MRLENTLPLQIIHFKEFVDEILKENGRLYKESILQKYSEDTTIKEILHFVFNKFIVTGIGSLKLDKEIWVDPLDITFYNFKQLVDFIKENNTGSDVVIKTIQREIDNFQDEYRELFRSIILKELNLGVHSSTINKVFGKDFIPKFDVMLAEKYHENIESVEGKDIIITPKLDGNRCVAIVDETGAVELRTRQGLVYEGLDHIEREISEHLEHGMVYDGELIAVNTDGLSSGDLYRLTTSILRRKEGDKTPIKFHIFDCLSIEEFTEGKSKTKASIRKKAIRDMLKDNNSNHLIEVPIIYEGKASFEIVNRLLNEATSTGEEGIMINLSDGIYECKRTRNLLKHKKFQTADVLVLGVSEADKSFKGMLGQIEVKFVVDGVEYTSLVGSGFSVEERKLYWEQPELLIGKVVEIGYFEISKNEKTGELGLRFPTWKGIIRTDKTDISDLSI